MEDEASSTGKVPPPSHKRTYIKLEAGLETRKNNGFRLKTYTEQTSALQTNSVSHSAPFDLTQCWF